MGVFSAVKAFFSVNQWAQWLAAGFALFIGYQGWKAKVKNDAERRINEKRLRERAELETKAIQTTETIRIEAKQNADEAISARDNAYVSPTDKLSDEQFERIFGYKRTPDQVS